MKKTLLILFLGFAPIAFWADHVHSAPPVSYNTGSESKSQGDGAAAVASGEEWDACKIRFVSTPAQPGQAYRCTGTFARTELVKSDTPNFAIYGKCYDSKHGEKDKTFLVPIKGDQWQGIYASALKAAAHDFKDPNRFTLAIKYRVPGPSLEVVQCASAIEIGYGTDIQ